MSSAVLATYPPGNNIENTHWLWFTDAMDISSALQSCTQGIKVNIPTYHTRAMRKILFDKFGLVFNNLNKATLRHFYRDLTGDKSVNSTLSEEVDERVNLLFKLEEPDFIYDLRVFSLISNYTGSIARIFILLPPLPLLNPLFYFQPACVLCNRIV